MFTKDDWLSSYFAEGAYKYTPSESSPPYPNGFIFVKLPVDQETQINTLLSDGFILAETLVYFSQQKLINCTSRFKVSWANKNDKTDIRHIASKAFTSSRLYTDPSIPNHVASKIKEDWAGNFFCDKRGDAMLVARDGSKTIGFLLLIENVIDLIAVSKDYQNQGIAKALISFANQEKGLLSAGTQLSNKTSIAFYQSSNFILKDAQYVLHKHSQSTR